MSFGLWPLSSMSWSCRKKRKQRDMVALNSGRKCRLPLSLHVCQACRMEWYWLVTPQTGTFNRGCTRISRSETCGCTHQHVRRQPQESNRKACALCAHKHLQISFTLACYSGYKLIATSLLSLFAVFFCLVSDVEEACFS